MNFRNVIEKKVRNLKQKIKEKEINDLLTDLISLINNNKKNKSNLE